MKWLIPLLAFQLTALGALPSMSVSDPAFLGHNRGAAAPAPTYLINQNFEGTGYDNSETWTESSGSSTIDEDYTATVLYGSQSLNVVGTVGADAYAKSPAFTAQSEVWFYWLFRPVVSANANRIIYRGMLAGVNKFNVRLKLTTKALELYDLTGGSAVTVATISTGTTYHIWGHYKADPDGILEIAFSTDGVKPTSGNNYASSTAGTLADNVDNVQVGNFSAATDDFIIDRVLVDDVEIGDNP